MKSAGLNIVLVGFMGTGKTTVGTQLARKLNMTFLDMDDEIVRREQMPVSRIFAEKGEPHFRALERALVIEWSGRAGLVIGTGGGIVLNPENIRDFSRTGLVVCLSLKPETIVERLAGDASRPLLAGEDKLKKIRDLLDKRRPLYDAIPHQIDRSTLDITQTVDQIIALVERMPA